ncbi:nitroreductase family protein [Cohnella fermenti]|uniref:Putative NAD(P)H nitroreductase n=1 Tax=Cohnella fermenti TaxID=2565925 RepID=A0A4V3WE29_9BACL|nr:nitroreductase [Cohnella fermenti]THF74584.1 nitroreductase [Cohnella fermenti]
MSDAMIRVVRERRTVHRYAPRPIAREVLLELLNDAVWAPFHSAKEPWRFIVFADEGRRAFADAVLATYPDDKRAKVGGHVARCYCEDVPVHLLVVMAEEPRPHQWEEAYAACCCLIQNLQLLAWERGIGFCWKTNDYNWNPKFREAVGVRPGEHVVGTLHMGYRDPSARIASPKPRTPAEELTVFRDSADQAPGPHERSR